MPTTHPSLGALIMALRDRKGPTQKAFAARMANVSGCTQGALSTWERDEYTPDAGQLEAILNAGEATDDERDEAHALALAARTKIVTPDDAAQAS